MIMEVNLMNMHEAERSEEPEDIDQVNWALLVLTYSICMADEE